MTIVLENVGAQSGVLALARGDALFVEAEGTVEPKHVSVLKGSPMSASRKVPLSVVSVRPLLGENQTNSVADAAAASGPSAISGPLVPLSRRSALRAFLASSLALR